MTEMPDFSSSTGIVGASMPDAVPGVRQTVSVQWSFNSTRENQTAGKIKGNYKLEEGSGTPESRPVSKNMLQKETRVTDTPGCHTPGVAPDSRGYIGTPSASLTVQGPVAPPEWPR